MILDDQGIFGCDAFCVEDPVDTILAGLTGKTMMGSARCAAKGIVKGEDQTFPDGNFI